MGLDHLEINVTGLSLLGHVLHRLSGSRSHQGEDVRSRSDQLDCFLTAQRTTQQDNTQHSKTTNPSDNMDPGLLSDL